MNATVITNADGSTQFLDRTLEEVTVSATRLPQILSNIYNIDAVRSQNLLRSCKFAAQFTSLPPFLASFFQGDFRKLTYLCDSVEFPGQVITAVDYRIPGTLKIKVPYAREINEVNFSFYFPNDLPIYDIMNTWIQEISPTTNANKYFDNIRGQIILHQFKDTETFGNQIGTNMKVQLIDVYPLNVQSLPSNWADDGFHKINVSFFFRDFNVL